MAAVAAFLCPASESAQQTGRPADGQAHDGVVVPFQPVEPEGCAALDGVGTGLVVGLFGSRVGVYLPSEIGKKVTLQLSTKLSVRTPSDTQTRYAPRGSRRTGRGASALRPPRCGACRRLRRHIHDGVTSQHHRAGWSFATARHLPRASFSTSWAGVGAVTPLSSKSLTQMVKSVVYKLRSSFRRGLPEAKIRFISLSSFSFCPWPQGPAFYDSARLFSVRALGPTPTCQWPPL